MQASQNKISELFNIKYPIIQAGMIWHSGWKLASAVSNCGGLGLSNIEENIQIHSGRRLKIVLLQPGTRKHIQKPSERRNESSSRSFFYQICSKM
jgi:NAD(P)H-dependent flavin oxidoreductase YrpB (nitropropane dioxygenase family)